METQNRAIAKTREGTVVGSREVAPNGTAYARFNGIPFAAPPVGPRRFAPPAPAESWSGERLCVDTPVIPPQRPSRLARVLGDYDLTQDEDCLTLNVTTPDLDDARRPVVVWLYGGAFVTGGHAIPWYDGAGFSRDHDVVFVGVNYRLGALGFSRIPGLSEGNLALHDQLAALRWVHANIARFGGDPHNVCLMGQSAGAMSIFALLASGETRGLVARVIMQSGRYGSFGSAEQAEEAGHALVKKAGGVEALRQAPTERILDWQVELIQAGARYGRTTTPFRPIADGALIRGDVWNRASSATKDLDVMLGWTRDEMGAFFSGNPQILAGTDAEVDEVFADAWGNNWSKGLQFTRARSVSEDRDKILGIGLNDAMFAGSTVTLAERLSAVQPPYVYRFDWAPPGSDFGACHCIELPFVFNNAQVWQPPMLAGASLASLERLGRTMQAMWAQFARSGAPTGPGLPPWPRYTSDARWTLRIDDMLEPVADIAGFGATGRPWPQRLSELAE